VASKVPQSERELDETVAGSHPRAVDDVARTAVSGDGAANGVLERGTLLDENFEVVELLGRGAMGAVYLVKHRALGKEFAAKVVARAGGLDPAAVARLRNEARMASAIDHENIVGVTHLGTLPDGSVFVVMERLRGEDLRARMLRQQDAEHPWLPDTEVRGLVPPLLSALSSAHAAGIVHRDLKPENVFLHHRRGRITPKLVDFGIGKLREPTDDLRLTATGQIVGTPLYMAPEQSRSSDLVDARSDLYTMGVLLFELLTGRLPFEAKNLYEIVLKHVTEPAPDARTIRPDLRPELAELVSRCLKKDPNERFQTADELLAAWRAAWGETAEEALASSYDGEAPPEMPRASGAGVSSSGARRMPTPTGPVVESRAMRSTVAAVVDPVAPSRSRLWIVGAVVLVLLAGAGFLLTRDAPDVPRVAAEPTTSGVGAERAVDRELGTNDESSEREPSVERAVEPNGVEPNGTEPSTTSVDPVAAPSTRRHRVTTEPSGATVLRDGIELGRTPLDLELGAQESASIELRLRGFSPIAREVGPNDPPDVSITLERVRRRSGPSYPELAPR
jgi:serine/threonine-protein kinase